MVSELIHQKDQENWPRRQNQPTPGQVWEGGGEVGDEQEERDGRVAYMGGVWGLGGNRPARPLLAGVVVFGRAGRLREVGVRGGKRDPRTRDRALVGREKLVASRHGVRQLLSRNALLITSTFTHISELKCKGEMMCKRHELIRALERTPLKCLSTKG